MKELLSDPNDEVVAAAAYAAAELRLKDAIPALVKLLGSESVAVRQESARGLGVMKAAEGGKALQALRKDQDKIVARMAEWAMQQLASK